MLRSRSPAHALDLIDFTADLINAIGLAETAEDERLRKVACYLADIGWRGHPDYRGEQSVDLIAYGSLIGVDHPGRAFLAEVLAVRYMGLKHKSLSTGLLGLAGDAGNARARLIGATFRVAYPMSAAMPGVLPRTSFSVQDGVLTLDLPSELAFLDGEHLRGRVEQLATRRGLQGHGDPGVGQGDGGHPQPQVRPEGQGARRKAADGGREPYALRSTQGRQTETQGRKGIVGGKARRTQEGQVTSIMDRPQTAALPALKAGGKVLRTSPDRMGRLVPSDPASALPRSRRSFTNRAISG